MCTGAVSLTAAVGLAFLRARVRVEIVPSTAEIEFVTEADFAVVMQPNGVLRNGCMLKKYLKYFHKNIN